MDNITLETLYYNLDKNTTIKLFYDLSIQSMQYLMLT